jgi:TPR repeat protein
MRNKFWMAVALAALMAAPGEAQSVKAGVEAWQRSDYAAAVAIWKPLAEKGDPDAAFNLGQAYRFGRGVRMSLADAQTWFETAARKGHVDAQTTLGLLLFQNGNQTGGLRWLKAAAEKGEPRAMLVYGTALFNGDGVQQNPVLGYAYVSRAAAQGLGPAKETLAQLDRILPLEDRRRGVAIAIDKARTAPAPSSKPTRPARSARTAPPKPAPQPEVIASVTVQEITKGWRIQLGAFSSRASGEALYRKLASKSALAGKVAFYGPVGSLIRLQVGPFASRAAAQAACNALKGQACFPVPGPNR